MLSAKVRDFIGGFVTECLETGSQAQLYSDKDLTMIGVTTVRGIGVVKHAQRISEIEDHAYPEQLGREMAKECTEVYNRQKYEDCLNPPLPGAA